MMNTEENDPQVKALELLCEATGKTLCPDCKCCEMAWEDCYKCGGEGGRDGYELMEEDPLWYDINDFEECDICEGKGGWMVCIGNCDENGKHPTWTRE